MSGGNVFIFTVPWQAHATIPRIPFRFLLVSDAGRPIAGTDSDKDENEIQTFGRFFLFLLEMCCGRGHLSTEKGFRVHFIGYLALPSVSYMEYRNIETQMFIYSSALICISL